MSIYFSPLVNVQVPASIQQILLICMGKTVYNIYVICGGCVCVCERERERERERELYTTCDLREDLNLE